MSDEPDEQPAPELPRNYEPEPGKRLFVRDSRTGDLGWMVRRGGVDMVRLDRPNHEVLKPYHPASWEPQVEVKRASHAQLVMVAYEADRALLRMMGEFGKARTEFRDLTEKQRLAWIEDGPQEPTIRRILYRSIIDVLSEHMVE